MRDKRPLPGQEYILKTHRNAETLASRGIGTHIHWVPGHVSVKGNERADILAKEGTKGKRLPHDATTSITYLKRKKQRTPNDDLERQVANHEVRPLLPRSAGNQHPPPLAKPPVTKISFNCHTDAYRTRLQPPIPSANTLIHSRIADLPLWLPAITPALAT